MVNSLRDAGHDVVYVRDVDRGADDSRVFALAVAQKRVLLTYDLYLGRLAVRCGNPEATGVMQLRLSGADPESDSAVVTAAMAAAGDWYGCIVVVEDDRLRVRRLRRDS